MKGTIAITWGEGAGTAAQWQTKRENRENNEKNKGVILKIVHNSQVK